MDQHRDGNPTHHFVSDTAQEDSCKPTPSMGFKGDQVDPEGSSFIQNRDVRLFTAGRDKSGRTSSGRSSRIGAGLRRTSWSATLPSQRRLSGPRPWVVITMRSPVAVLNRLHSSSATDPSSNSGVTATGATASKRFA